MTENVSMHAYRLALFPPIKQHVGLAQNRVLGNHQGFKAVSKQGKSGTIQPPLGQVKGRKEDKEILVKGRQKD